MTASVTCEVCGKAVRGQARKRALYFGESVKCSACERARKDPPARPEPQTDRELGALEGEEDARELG